jgi:hypothetical protein
MHSAIIETTLPARVILETADRICRANNVRTLLPPVAVSPAGLLTVRSIYLPLSGVWLATELIADLGLDGAQTVEREV